MAVKAKVDKDLCTNCGLCVDTCPEVFEMSGDITVVKAEIVPANSEKSAKEAAENCPVEAIIIEVIQ
jgi:ferredoxin